MAEFRQLRKFGIDSFGKAVGDFSARFAGDVVDDRIDIAFGRARESVSLAPVKAARVASSAARRGLCLQSRLEPLGELPTLIASCPASLRVPIALVDGLAQRRELQLLLFEQSKSRSHHFARVAVLAGFDLPHDEGVILGR